MNSDLKVPADIFSVHSEPRTEGVPIDTIIVHSMHNPESQNPLALEACIAALDKYKVSAHYLISKRGKVFNLVAEDRTAWHAGVAALPDGRTKVNWSSIGIELLNFENADFSASQYRALTKLVREICSRHPIRYILGHEHVAQPPGRKRDPGPHFDWTRFRSELGPLGSPVTFPTVGNP